VITVCFNSERTIRDTLESVFSQNYPDVEYLVIDGQSTDGTLRIVEEFRPRIARIVSESDRGIYDAMNKGIRLATGDIVAILNSDDVFADPGVVRDVVDAFERTGADCAFGDLVYVARDDVSVVQRHWKSSDFQPGSFRRGWHPPHPAFFVRRSVYERFGSFDTELTFSADFELMLRLLERHRVPWCRIPRVLVRMRAGGTANRIRNIIEGNRNCLRAFRKNGISVSWLYPVLRLVPKLRQFPWARTWAG
jgi:glycosyltransferase involved in cell wall biosynthesis